MAATQTPAAARAPGPGFRRRVQESLLRASPPPGSPKEPIRSELFSIERLEQYAEGLAASHRLTRKPSKGHALLPRVKENARVLADCHLRISRAVREERAITPAAEWLLDNFHVVEEQVREIIDDLPPGFYRELPKLSAGPMSGYPRVFALAWDFVAHTDSRFDPEWLRRFTRAYQRGDPFLIGEVWALAISLRIVLVENLRRLAERITVTRAARQEADALADGLLGLRGGASPSDPSALLRPFEKSPLPRAFAVQLVQRLREQGEQMAPAVQWLDARLTAQGSTAEDIVREEHQEEAAMNATVRNVITSMRLVSGLDWAQFFEEIAAVDDVLRAGSGFAAMDFSTRDQYRHAIEELSRRSGLAEIDVARRAVQAAKTAREAAGTGEAVPGNGGGPREAPHSPSGTARKGDPGYYLISEGRPGFEGAIGFRPTLKQRFLRACRPWTTPLYLGGVAAATGVLLAAPLFLTRAGGADALALAGWGLLGLIPASDLAVALVNFFVMESIAPKALPKLDFSTGIPPEARTLVVMPVLLTNPEAVQEYVERLEIHYLSNPDGHVHFALLSDWTDAPSENMPEDDALLAAASRGISRLNERHGRGPQNALRFHLLHRKRRWNPSERLWMGWERKRGKLHELNRLLRGETDTSFLPDASGRPAAFPDFRYVITLDADTRMSRGAAYRLAGAMAHPLNRPRYDAAAGRVVEGYGVMQPRVTPSLPTTGSSTLYQKLYSGPAGIDPYAFAVSDVYQDLFGEGSYVGKGIYAVDAFESSLRGRVPENAMLSHDLFEGIYARTALVTDVELFEEFPSHEEVAASRVHRWTRGDWQLLPWIFGRGPRAAERRDGSLPAVSRWKMIDNLRRSLSAPAAFLGLLAASLWENPSAGVWTVFLLSMIAGPHFLPVLTGVFPPGRKVSWTSHLTGIAEDLRLGVIHAVLDLVTLARRAGAMADAVLRTLYRLLVSRRPMLEWVSAAQAKCAFDGKMRDVSRGAHLSPAAAAGLALAALLLDAPKPWSALIPLCLLWLLAPWAGERLSRPSGNGEAKPLTDEDRRLFRRIARKTWLFFETFVTAEDHFLPPDNFQEVPHPVAARRTSATNIGLYLLSIPAARDFGWIGLLEAVERMEATMATLQKLKLCHGHLYNWYDTRDLRVLDPPYVSTVDSGNLAGHLWAVGNACRELAVIPLPAGDVFPGLEDVLSLIGEAAGDAVDHGRAGTVTGPQVHETLAALREDLKAAPATPAEWESSLAGLREKAVALADIARTLAAAHPGAGKEDTLMWSDVLVRQIEGHQRSLKEGEADAPALIRRLAALARRCDEIVEGMDFTLLFDPAKKLFSIGYQAEEKKADPGHYDLLATEARLASFVAIAKGEVPSSHWFRLVRSFTPTAGGPALLSWSGSMFEYLMPSLVMHAPAGGLLEQTCRAVVARQVAYGRERDVPWGVSESAFNVQNLEFSYQYSNFGVPGLGLKRGLAEDLLVAPYATALASAVDAPAAAGNFKRLAAAGAEGRYGFYDALDYTQARLPEGQKVAVVRTYMAHHQGMVITALGNAICGNLMRARFHAEPMVQAAELLLQERTPRNIRMTRFQSEEAQAEVHALVPPVLRRFDSPHDAPPRTHLLSNGRYSVMVTAAGSGYSRWRGLAVTRWREDPTRDAQGTYIFLRDVRSGDVWSAGYQPTGVEPESYEVDFTEERAEIARKDGSLLTTLEVVVSSEDDAEVRRVTLKNLGTQPREIELTSYAEVVLADPAADTAHPAFSNLFVRTEFVPEVNGLLCARRPRSPEDPSPWGAHVVVVEGESPGALEYETDRARFLGRGRDVRAPMCITDGKPLSNTVGAVIDPIVSLRRRVRIDPGESARVTFTTLAAPSRQEALNLADKYHDPAMFERTVTLAWTQAQIQRHHLGIAAEETHLFQELAGRIIHSDASLRPPAGTLQRNTLGQRALWPYGISGDLPIVLVRIDEPEDREIVREVLRAHEYWHMKDLEADLVILNEKGASYSQELQNALEAIVRTKQAAHRHDASPSRGGIFVLRAERLSPEERRLLSTTARIVLLSRQGSLSRQLERLERSSRQAAVGPSFAPRRPAPPAAAETPKLQFFNGLGGFSEDGREYVTVLGPGQWTPAPWINVISNPEFGFQVSESGSGPTWSSNSRENRLTPWSNDPVSDTPGEALYLRDEESGEVWTTTPLPVREDAPYTARHGQGYTRFEHESHGIAADLLQFVPAADPVKISRLTLTNRSGRPRRISVTAYAEWVLGSARAGCAPFIITELEERTGAVLARNPWNGEFGERVSFADMAGKQSSWTADRTEFLGRNGSYERPAALQAGRRLSGSVGAGLDPCAALQTVVQLRPGAQVKIDFFLGQAASRWSAVELIQRYRVADLDAKLAEVRERWKGILETVQVRTPDRSMDILLNRWLLYQTLGCRLWARSGFYQGGGAYGFRDQLQDVMALVVSRRDLAREHVLRAASRQFAEGDVQHWWHPPAGRGVRTKIADDPAWLPYAVLHYVEVTGDAAILDEQIPFLEGPRIPDGKEDAYFQPTESAGKASLFEHCARALDHCLPVGPHGLPLMGAGDWNDGMNRVGREGKGESVWLAWFLHATLWEFSKVAESRGDAARAEKWRLHVGELKAAVERNGWDGDWYRRAFFDDGTPLGSAANAECRIDSVAQSWGVLSGAADPARAARAMAAVEENLLRKGDGLMLLLTPPFNRTRPDPGYIQGYLPGVRENGGQYTHAAVWALLAFAAMGEGDKAASIFSLLNPIRHGSTRADIHKYKVEPYVAAADVYGEAPHVGRGGWTWYTGSAGWMYRAGIEWILGFRLRGTTVFIDPCIPRAWPGFEVSFRYHSTRYEIKVENPKGVSRGVKSAEMDGKSVRGGSPIMLVDDGATHQVRIVLG